MKAPALALALLALCAASAQASTITLGGAVRNGVVVGKAEDGTPWYWGQYGVKPRLSGRVLDDAGRPAAGVFVLIQYWDVVRERWAPALDDETDRAGRFTITATDSLGYFPRETGWFRAVISKDNIGLTPSASSEIGYLVVPSIELTSPASGKARAFTISGRLRASAVTGRGTLELRRGTRTIATRRIKGNQRFSFSDAVTRSGTYSYTLTYYPADERSVPAQRTTRVAVKLPPPPPVNDPSPPPSTVTYTSTRAPVRPGPGFVVNPDTPH